MTTLAFPPSRILVPLDYSEPSLSALEAAKLLTRRFGCALELVYVEDLQVALPRFSNPGEIYSAPGLLRELEEFRRWREEKMRKLAESLDGARVKVRMTTGWPSHKLAEMASRARADLVVMGTHGYRGLSRVFFGSVAETVVRSARVPVLTVHERKGPPRVAKALLPFNMEPYAGAALRYGAQAALALKARAAVLYVSPSKGDVLEDEARLRRHLEAELGRAAAERLEVRVRAGDPRRVILEEAASGGFDLIVLSAHRRTLLGDLVIGSTAERVLRHSPVPVLSVPSGAPVPREKVYFLSRGTARHRRAVPREKSAAAGVAA